MASQRTMLAIGIGISAAVHASALMWGVRYGIDRLPPLPAPPDKIAEMTVLPADPGKPEKPESILGEAGGIGEALNNSVSAIEQQARLGGQDQAALTREESGGPGEAFAEQMPAFQNLSPPAVEPIRGVAEKPMSIATIGLPTVQQPHIANVAPATPVVAEQPKQTDNPTPAPEATVPKPAGELAEASDRDSDAFSTKAGVDYVNGRVAARDGRAFKFARARINLGAYFDPMELSLPITTVMQLDVDEAGAVRRVVVTRSSGSKSLDRVLELAMYESTFEPRRDAAGKPVPDRFNFSFVIR